jgi:hypothetical protein
MKIAVALNPRQLSGGAKTVDGALDALTRFAEEVIHRLDA